MYASTGSWKLLEGYKMGDQKGHAYLNHLMLVPRPPNEWIGKGLVSPKMFVADKYSIFYIM